MKRALVLGALAAVLVIQASAVSLGAAEALVGIWRLERQEINGQAGDIDPIAFQVSEARDAYSFVFSVPIQDIYVVTLRYTVRLDGSVADVKTGNGEKVGTIQMTRTAAGRYTLVMKGASRPDSKGTLTVSADGQTLISESDATQSGRTIHSRQTFSRYQ
jgi:hypothetical protein